MATRRTQAPQQGVRRRQAVDSKPLSPQKRTALRWQAEDLNAKRYTRMRLEEILEGNLTPTG